MTKKMISVVYDATKKYVVKSKEELIHVLTEADSSFYVYVLCFPPVAPEMRPFYIGIGQGDRVFAHEAEAKLLESKGRKVDAIRKIWNSGGEVVRIIDDCYSSAPYIREEELITKFGLLKDETGILSNEQRYSPSNIFDGVELRKYAGEGNNLPKNFIRRDTCLKVGSRRPKDSVSVYGKIYCVLESNPGVTGAELVELLLLVDFSSNDTLYTKSGMVSRPWLAKYIDGGFYAKNRFIQEQDHKNRGLVKTKPI